MGLSGERDGNQGIDEVMIKLEPKDVGQITILIDDNINPLYTLITKYFFKKFLF